MLCACLQNLINQVSIKDMNYRNLNNFRERKSGKKNSFGIESTYDSTAPDCTLVKKNYYYREKKKISFI